MVACLSHFSFAAIPFNEAFPMSFKNGLPNGWTAGGTTDVVDGGTKVTCTLNNGKYRADLKYNMTNTSDALYVEVDATEYKVFAMQCIGSCAESGNIKGNIYIDGNDWTAKMNIGWTELPKGKIVDVNGNYTYYWVINADSEAWTGTKTITKIEYKIADITNEADNTYIISDFNWFKSLEELENSIVTEEFTAVINQRTNKGYADLNSAWDAASDGDVLVVNENQTLSSRKGSNNRSITVKGANDEITISRGYNGAIFLSNNNGKHITLDNIIIDGKNISSNTQLLESGATNSYIDFNNVTITNVNYTAGNNNAIVVAKGGGKLAINGLSFRNCQIADGKADVFIGSKGTTISGNNNLSIMMQVNGNDEIALTVPENGELTNETPITLIPFSSKPEEVAAEFVAGKTIVYGNEDPSKFNIQGNSNMTLKAENGNLVAAVDSETGVTDIISDNTDAPVEYYNMQGVKVANPENGIFIRVQGKDVKKVVIK